MSLQKLVCLVSPENDDNIAKSFKNLDGWQVLVKSTGPNTDINITDVTSLSKLLEGCDTCFVETHTDYSSDRNIEVTQGKCIGEACKKAGVKHVILSAHLSCEKTIGIPARHYDSKAEIYDYMRMVLGLPTTMINIPPFYEMFFDFLCPIRVSHQQCDVVFPSVGAAPVAFLAREDVGPCLLRIITNPKAYMHKTIALCGDLLSGKMVTTILNDYLLDFQFKQRQVTVQELRDRPNLGSIDIANMFEFLGRVDLRASPANTRNLYPNVTDFDTWVMKNAEKLYHSIVGHQNSVPSISAVV